MLFYMLMHSVR